MVNKIEINNKVIKSKKYNSNGILAKSCTFINCTFSNNYLFCSNVIFVDCIFINKNIDGSDIYFAK